MKNKSFRLLILSLPVVLMFMLASDAFVVLPTKDQPDAVTELVMHEGVVIEAQMPDAAIAVISGRGFDRAYRWDDCELKSHMRARAYRWFGSLGIYDPGASFIPALGGCAGISRTVVEEGQLHFDDMEFVDKWIKQRAKSYRTVWTNDGILVSWNFVPARAQLNVEVFMLCIQGKRPRRLVGASDLVLRVKANSQGQRFFGCAQVKQDVIGKTRSQIEEDWRTFGVH